MAEKISNEKIYEKLLELEKLVKNRNHKKKFDNITDWKKYVWDNCPDKNEKIEKNEIYFFCKALKDTCDFRKCPRN